MPLGRHLLLFGVMSESFTELQTSGCSVESLLGFGPNMLLGEGQRFRCGIMFRTALLAGFISTTNSFSLRGVDSKILIDNKDFVILPPM